MSTPDQIRSAVTSNVVAALTEDIGGGDLTADLLPDTAKARAIVVARDTMTMAGQPWFNEVFRQLDPDLAVAWLCNDGDVVSVDSEICIVSGSARSILSGERAALNFLQLLSATASTTARYVDAVAKTKVRILDTRKTIPGLRIAQKYAVRCGGGENHRIGLFDAVLIKENHIISCGGIKPAIALARRNHTDMVIEIEVESLSELKEALEAGADRLLLDNFDIADLQAAVDLNQEFGHPPAELEASGGINLESIRSVAETGVDYISVGALTKDVRAVDLSMRFSFDA